MVLKHCTPSLSIISCLYLTHSLTPLSFSHSLTCSPLSSTFSPLSLTCHLSLSFSLSLLSLSCSPLSNTHIHFCSPLSNTHSLSSPKHTHMLNLHTHTSHTHSLYLSLTFTQTHTLLTHSLTCTNIQKISLTLLHVGMQQRVKLTELL